METPEVCAPLLTSKNQGMFEVGKRFDPPPVGGGSNLSGLVAQRIERVPRKAVVAGSNPVEPSTSSLRSGPPARGALSFVALEIMRRESTRVNEKVR